MANIETLWVGMITSGGNDFGTDSPIVLIINESGDEVDVVHYTFPDTAQSDQESGQANLYEITEEEFATRGGRVFEPLNLNESSIRIGIRGDDAWVAGSVFVWGQERDGLIVPLALLPGRQSGRGVLPSFTLSTDADEAPRISVALPRTQLGPSIILIRRLILLLSTADVADAGTDDQIQLQITTSDGRMVVDHLFKDTSQDDLERGEANFYYVPVNITFFRTELNADSVRLSIKGNDAWLPARLFLFGLSDDEFQEERIEFVVPLVHLPTWTFGSLSTDPEEGEESVTLPLVDTPLLPPVPGPVLT